MFDIKLVEAEARKELNEEKSVKAKIKIKTKLKEIATAEMVLANLRREYDLLLVDIGNE